MAVDIKQDDIIHIKTEDISERGEGIGKLNGFTWFVRGAVTGDVVEAKVTEVKKTYGVAETVKILIPSPCRVKPLCPYFYKCGGCQLQTMDYTAQLRFKEDLVKGRLKRIGCVEDADKPVRPVIGMEYPWRYRNNEQFFCGYDGSGTPAFGFYAGKTHELVCLEDCLAGVEENTLILKAVAEYMKEHKILPFDEKTGKGLVERVQIRKGFKSGDILICLDIHGPADALKDPALLTDRLCSLFPGGESKAHIETVCCRSINKSLSAGNRDKITHIYGPGTMTDDIGGLTFQISPASFYQVNPLQTERLYDTVLEFAHLTGTETVWDLYCGIGTISLLLSRRSKQVYGVEIAPGAVSDAVDNAKRNGIDNVRFFAGKAEKILPQQSERDHTRADVIVLDPPRKGCERECLNTMIKMRPDRIVYVSCDPATLARDIKILCRGGYELMAVQPVDLFPQTVHIENVALLAIPSLFV